MMRVSMAAQMTIQKLSEGGVIKMQMVNLDLGNYADMGMNFLVY